MRQRGRCGGAARRWTKRPPPPRTRSKKESRRSRKERQTRSARPPGTPPKRSERPPKTRRNRSRGTDPTAPAGLASAKDEAPPAGCCSAGGALRASRCLAFGSASIGEEEAPRRSPAPRSPRRVLGERLLQPSNRNASRSREHPAACSALPSMPSAHPAQSVTTTCPPRRRPCPPGPALRRPSTEEASSITASTSTPPVPRPVRSTGSRSNRQNRQRRRDGPRKVSLRRSSFRLLQHCSRLGAHVRVVKIQPLKSPPARVACDPSPALPTSHAWPRAPERQGPAGRPAPVRRRPSRSPLRRSAILPSSSWWRRVSAGSLQSRHPFAEGAGHRLRRGLRSSRPGRPGPA